MEAGGRRESPGFEMSWKVERIEPEMPDTIDGPTAVSPISPAMSTTEPLRSGLLATCPSLRASVLRLAVGFSVLSSSAMAVSI